MKSLKKLEKFRNLVTYIALAICVISIFIWEELVRPAAILLFILLAIEVVINIKCTKLKCECDKKED